MLKESEVLAQTYFDKCTIKRKEKVKNELTGVTESTLALVYENIKCAVSKSDNQLMTVDGVGKLSYSHKLFTFPNINILEGDIIEVTSMGIVAEYIASKSFIYPSHSETLVTFKEYV